METATCGRHVVVALVMAVVLSLSSCDAGTVHLYVSPAGSDSNDGKSTSHPVKTLQHAVDMLQDTGISGNNVFVELMAGDHVLTATLNVSNAIHGSATFRAFQGQAVHVIGGPRIPSSSFRSVTDQHALQQLAAPSVGHVVELDLVAAGLSADLGQLQHTYFNQKTTAPLEVSLNGEPLVLARWPNQGYVNIKSIPDGTHGKRITYDASGSSDTKWPQERQPWAYGWWCRGWSDAHLPISSVDPKSHTITLAELEGHGVCVGHLGEFIKSASGGYFRVINMLSELDSPGEYYVDRTALKLYLWPSTQHGTLVSSDRVFASMLTNCVTVGSAVRNLHFEDFTLESCRRYGFDLHDAQHVSFRNMEIKNTGSYAINCESDCRSVSIMASEIYNTTGGVWIEGGDRQTLTSSQNLIRDNDIHHYSRLAGNIGDAIRIYNGVGMKVQYNRVHHGAYTGIRFSGNEHQIINNDVHHLCQDTCDCGGIHSSGHWSYRGNVVQRNHIHHVLRNKPGPDVRGVMLDDEMSSVLAANNVFYDNECHLNNGGGRDSDVRQNVFYNAMAHSIQVDGRGIKRPEHYASWLKELDTLPYQSGVWAQKYPHLAHILQNNASAPVGNTISNNIYYNQPHIGWMYCWDGVCDRKDWFNIHDNFMASGPSDFRNVSDADFYVSSGHIPLAAWQRDHSFPRPVYRREVGPQQTVGPHYLNGHRRSVGQA